MSHLCVSAAIGTWKTPVKNAYCAFLSANYLSSNEGQKPHGLSVVARYRDWSLGELGLNPNTVNKRLNLVVRFYDWCKRQGYVLGDDSGVEPLAAYPGLEVNHFKHPSGAEWTSERWIVERFQ